MILDNPIIDPDVNGQIPDQSIIVLADPGQISDILVLTLLSTDSLRFIIVVHGQS